MAARFETGDGRLERHWLDLRRRMETVKVGGDADSTTLEFIFVVDRRSVEAREGYRLRVAPDRIELVGGSAAGCFYAQQTLSQLMDHACGDALPCCTIDDAPNLRLRGLLHDVTRGKAPTLATLKAMAGRLARLKLNQLQLYIEHAFVFDFDREICDPDHGLTPDEVRELAACCRERFIDLVPAVATLGHMGRILSMPRYAHLAEIPAPVPWERMSWLQRLRGLTLDVLSDESLALVRSIWSDVLDAFGPPAANICGDEPHDLGRGRNAGRLSGEAASRAYVDRIAATAELVRRRGARPQFWSDVAARHPEAIDRLPRDVAVLHWGYDDRADYEGTRRFVEAGLETIVCPGTSGWKRIINAVDLAERNIAAFSQAARMHGAAGLLNTDWGDWGHLNALGCAWHGIALGAARAWRTDHPIGAEFDRRFMRWVCGDDPRPAAGVGLPAKGFGASSSVGPFDALDGPALLRRASRLAGACETWRLFCQEYDTWEVAGLPPDDLIDEAREAAVRLASWCDAAALTDFGAFAADLTDWRLAAELTETLCDRLRACRRGGPDSLGDAGARRRLGEWSSRFASHWLANNKPSDLDRLLTVLERLAGSGAGAG